ncbi:MAG: hypothetical protein HQK50_05365 [Oligoflexia bacterium]|nr:hypothetical protein [Oligoflexia bacterium]MBF0364977.1 hypothetical protein [Oligoflexia bacterium]
MVNKIFITLLFFFTTITSAQAYTVRNSTRVLHINIAASALLSLGTFRIGRQNFEVGIYPDLLIGAGGIINIPNNLYATIAAGIIQNDLGFYGGFGIEFYKFWACNFRIEMGGVSSTKNYTSGHALLGLNVGF